MKSSFNNQQFVDMFSEGLTIINRRTKERDIAIGTAVILGVMIVGYIGYRLYDRSKEARLIQADTVPVATNPVAKDQQQTVSAVPANETVHNYDGVFMFSKPAIINKTDMYSHD